MAESEGESSGETSPAEPWRAEVMSFKHRVLVEEGLAQNTVESYLQDIKDFLAFCLAREVDDLGDVDIFLITDYLEICRGREYAPGTISRRLATLNRFFQHLKREGIVGSNPVEMVDRPREGDKYPDYLSEEEVESLLAAPDVEEPEGLLERTVLELLYGCGLRASELANLKGENLDWERGEIRVEGKGSKQRIVPVGRQALRWLRKYAEEFEPSPGGAGEFFVNQNGNSLSRQKVWEIVKKNARQANLHDVSPHTLRHSFATHMLSRGADLRSLQEMLGHSDVGTTADIYVHLRDEVSSAHANFHPRGN